jgi:glycosyltransferase involved in cell wall biosynthesis
MGDLFLASKITKFLKSIERPLILVFKLNDAHVFAKISAKHPSLPTHFVINSTLSKGLSGNTRMVKHVSLTLNHMRKLICVSRGVAQHIISNYGIDADRVKVIYNPLIDRTATPEPDDCSHAWLSESSQTIPTYLSAGRLVSAKDFTTLIQAFAKVIKTQDARLIILGEGMLRQQLEALVNDLGLKNRVSLPGFVTHPKAYMRRANIFVLSSKNEGLGNVLIEALQSGTRVVSTDCPNGPREILLDGKLGPLVKPGDADALAEAMLATLTTPAPDPKLVAESLERFDADLITDQYLELSQGL